MKSNKQRYNESISKRQGTNSGGSNGSGPMWVIIFIIIFAALISMYMGWNEGILGKGDLTIGIGKPIPDADEIGKRFR